MRQLDSRADELKSGVEAARHQRNQVYAGGKAEGGDKTYKDDILGKIDDVRKARATHKEGVDKLNALKTEQRELENEKAAILKTIPRNYHTPEDLRQAIKGKQQRYETSSMSNAEEKRLLRDIDALKKGVPDMEKLGTIEPELTQIREKRKVLTAELDASRKIIDDKNE